MKSVLYLLLTAYIAMLPAWTVGALVSLVNEDWGFALTSGIFSWLFVELVYARKEKWWV